MSKMILLLSSGVQATESGQCKGTKARTACIESVSAFNARTILSKEETNILNHFLTS